MVGNTPPLQLLPAKEIEIGRIDTDKQSRRLFKK